MLRRHCRAILEQLAKQHQRSITTMWSSGAVGNVTIAGHGRSNACIAAELPSLQTSMFGSQPLSLTDFVPQPHSSVGSTTHRCVSLAAYQQQRCTKASGASASTMHGLSSSPRSSGSARQRARSRRGECGASARQLTTSAQEALAPGRILEFRKDDRFVLALIRRPEGKKSWIGVDDRGQEYSIRQQQVVFLVPGSGYSEEDLAELAGRGQSSVEDVALLETAWEVVQDETGAMFDIERMADFLFGATSAADCYATHRLLALDRCWFKQAGRVPPLWQPRPLEEVRQIQAQAEAKRKAREELQAFAGRVAKVRSLAARKRPTREAWMGSTDAARVAALWDYGLADNPSAQAASTAMAALQAVGMVPSCNSAVALLRSLGVLGPHEPVQLYRVGVGAMFAPKLQAAAEAIAMEPPPDPLAALRHDATQQKVFLIDDAGTVEVDDGVSAERLEDGKLQVWVHVADPTRYLPPHHPLVSEAASRTKTCYLPTGSVPMFPPVLSAGPFSLQRGQRCGAMSVRCVLNEDGSLDDAEVLPTEVLPTYQLTYDDVDELLEGAEPEQEPELFLLQQAAKLRRKWRNSQGSVDFNFPQADIKVTFPLDDGDELGEPCITITADDQSASEARQLVAELMILAGEAVGRLGDAAGLALPYRGQAEVVIPPDADLDAFPPGMCRNAELRRYMRGARYSVRTASPHAGLGLPAYVQFTSPIRRIGDLLAHYQFQALMLGQQPPYDATQLEIILDSAQERVKVLNSAEYEIQQQWVAAYFKQQMRDQPGRTYEALMLNWRHRDRGIGRLFLEELALEVGLPLSRPVQPGARMTLRCTAADPDAPSFKLEEVIQPHVSAVDDVDESEEGEQHSMSVAA